jgi:hypothetical protein
MLHRLRLICALYDQCSTFRSGLEPKSLRGNWFIKVKKTLQKKLHITLKMRLFHLKMYLKSLTIIKKASMSLKKSSEIIVLFIKAAIFLEMSFERLFIFIKASHFHPTLMQKLPFIWK